MPGVKEKKERSKKIKSYKFKNQQGVQQADE